MNDQSPNPADEHSKSPTPIGYFVEHKQPWLVMYTGGWIVLFLLLGLVALTYEL